MPKKADAPLDRIHIQLFTSDHLILQSLFSTNIGVSPAIRKIIHSFIENNNLSLAQVGRGLEVIIDD